MKSKRPRERKTRCERSVRVPYIPKDCIYDILVRIPAHSLWPLRLVCKSWYEIIHDPDFIKSNLKSSAVGIILMSPTSTIFEPWFERPSRLARIKFLRLNKDGTHTIEDYKITCKGGIVASCNGIIVLEERKKETSRLFALNPVTKERNEIPRGTFSLHPLSSSYGLAFCGTSRRYKLVHLFSDNGALSCELMDIGNNGPWRRVDVPRGIRGSLWFFESVFALGAFHWHISGSGGFVLTFRVSDEKFKSMKLPGIGAYSKQVFAMDDFLGLASREEHNGPMDVWILKSLDEGGEEEDWEKLYTVNLRDVEYPSLNPIYGVKADGRDEIFFRNNADSCLWAYNHRLRCMRRISPDTDDYLWKLPLPHVNTLLTWAQFVRGY